MSSVPPATCQLRLLGLSSSPRGVSHLLSVFPLMRCCFCLQVMGAVEAKDIVATLEISIWVSRAVLQGAHDGLVMLGSWHQQLQPPAEHPPLQAG